MRSTTTKRHDRFNMQLNSILNWPWRIGAWPRQWGRTTTILPDPDRYKRAHDSVQNAVDLSAGASPSEQAYIQAMAKRFPADPNSDLKKAAEEYHDAMRQVAAHFPDDLDAATLFAESGMNLHPWGLWHQDGTPQAGTEEIVATLESVYEA